MGKGTIISGGEGGEYSVQLSMSKDRVQEQIDDLTTKIDILEDAIDDADDKVDDLEAEASALEYQVSLLGPGSAQDAKVKELVQKQNEVLVARLSRDMLELKKTSCEKKIEYLESHVPEEDPTVTAWCADLTEDLSGDVGTIEVPGERGIVLIQPGYEGNAVYDSERDGQLESAVAGTPSGTFYNLAMQPGWQKWMPTYRFGTISNLDKDADTCDITLESALSSQQELSVNQAANLIGVSIDYMDCNAVAFEDGDLVLVKFEGQDWDTPKVIGFKSDPKPCEFYIDFTINDEVPLYTKKIKVVDAEDVEQIISSTTEEPGRVGPFQPAAWPIKVYLYCYSGADAPDGEQELFTYYKTPGDNYVYAQITDIDNPHGYSERSHLTAGYGAELPGEGLVFSLSVSRVYYTLYDSLEGPPFAPINFETYLLGRLQPPDPGFAGLPDICTPYTASYSWSGEYVSYVSYVSGGYPGYTDTIWYYFDFPVCIATAGQRRNGLGSYSLSTMCIISDEDGQNPEFGDAYVATSYFDAWVESYQFINFIWPDCGYEFEVICSYGDVPNGVTVADAFKTMWKKIATPVGRI